MAQFKINENRVNPGYFTDDNLNRKNRNNVLTDRTALERPRSDSEIFQTNLDYQLNYGNSISELQNTMEDMDKVTGDFYDLTGISLNMNDYIAEVDDYYLNIDYDKVIEYAMHDERLGYSHWSVPGPDGDFGYGGHCFPKDVKALYSVAMELESNVDPIMLRATNEKNNKVRKNRDWEKQKGRAVINK